MDVIEGAAEEGFDVDGRELREWVDACKLALKRSRTIDSVSAMIRFVDMPSRGGTKQMVVLGSERLGDLYMIHDTRVSHGYRYRFISLDRRKKIESTNIDNVRDRIRLWASNRAFAKLEAQDGADDLI
jgi:hypothetical protein